LNHIIIRIAIRILFAVQLVLLQKLSVILLKFVLLNNVVIALLVRNLIIVDVLLDIDLAKTECVTLVANRDWIDLFTLIIFIALCLHLLNHEFTHLLVLRQYAVLILIFLMQRIETFKIG
jgi:hypothetical protein